MNEDEIDRGRYVTGKHTMQIGMPKVLQLAGFVAGLFLLPALDLRSAETTR